jgi:uncharacterized C2H2 Zn-finger protein
MYQTLIGRFFIKVIAIGTDKVYINYGDYMKMKHKVSGISDVKRSNTYEYETVHYSICDTPKYSTKCPKCGKLGMRRKSYSTGAVYYTHIEFFDRPTNVKKKTNPFGGQAKGRTKRTIYCE